MTARLAALASAMAVAASIAVCTRAQGEVVTALEEVVVTARRIDEASFDVPLSIDVVGHDWLASGGPKDLARLAARSPGLYFESLWGGTGSAPVLRGQSQPSTAGNNVGVFVDGVYQAERTAIDVAPLDIERIEIARGPQSTLFGHSTFAGAIHYVPRRPTADLRAGGTLSTGTDRYFAADGFVSGPLFLDSLRGRLAAGLTDSVGTWRNAADGRALGGLERRAVAGAVDWLVSDAWQARLSGRWSRTTSSHPAVSTVDGAAYNCGAIDATSGAWSYYCGSLPTVRHSAVTAGLPDSRSVVSQGLLALAYEGSGYVFESDTSYYRGDSELIRDFDATAAGETFGVCTLPDCPRAQGPPVPVQRSVQVNSVSRSQPETEEFTQDFRVRGSTDTALQWLVGVTGFRSEERSRTAFGFARGDLAIDEQLTIVLPLSSGIAGPVARANAFLVADPARQQVTQTSTASRRDTLAMYGVVDYRPIEPVGLRAELRSTWERLSVTGPDGADRRFDDLTPRFSIDYTPRAGALVYASAAKGSRSGGINTTTGLAADEQTFEPEYNWTYELAGRYSTGTWRADATFFYIDWRNTQLLGFPTTPGINTLIVRNTQGVSTRGVELSFDAQLHARLSVSAAYALADSEFASGSDDPGSSAFCGLRGANRTSSFCVVGPSRVVSTPGGTYVPYIDDNRLQRAPEQQWRVGLLGDLSPAGSDWSLTAGVDVSGQDDVYDRAINGAEFGQRTLLSMQLRWSAGPWSLELWGQNLTDELYARSVASRGAQFYPISPRPLDLLYGDGRRAGITVRYER